MIKMMVNYLVMKLIKIHGSKQFLQVNKTGIQAV